MTIRGLRAVVFDLDGVLVDSEPLFHEAINRVLSQEGVAPLSVEEYGRLLGTTVEETWRTIQGWRRLPQKLAYYLERYDPAVREVLQEQMVPQPGVLRLLNDLKKRGVPRAVASSSLRSWVDLKLGVLGIAEEFDAIVGGDEVARGKPAPDIYLEAARRLGVPPTSCLAIEDSPPGIASAVAAGMFTVAVRTASTAGMNLQQATIVLNSLGEFNLTLLEDTAPLRAGAEPRQSRAR